MIAMAASMRCNTPFQRAALVSNVWTRIEHPMRSFFESVMSTPPCFSSSTAAIVYCDTSLLSRTIASSSGTLSPDALTKPSKRERSASAVTAFSGQQHAISKQLKSVGSAMPRLHSPAVTRWS